MKRVAIVTGGTRGIGAAISQELKNRGVTVIANYASNDERAQIFAQQSGVQVMKWDVSSETECRENINKILKEQGQIDILINNAGITRDGFLHKIGSDAWGDVLNTNLNSCFYMTQGVITQMRERQFGRIINISSINAQKGQLGQTNYCAAKAGMVGFTKALALENAAKGITVNVVAPGYIDTDMVRAVSEPILQGIIQQIPAGRLGKPEEIAKAVAYLADESSGFITGSTLTINGGQHMA